MPNIRDSYRYKPNKHFGVIYPPSQTVPGQSYTVGEMVRRFRNGQQLYSMPQAIFTDGVDIVPPNWELMSEMEQRDYARAIAARKDDIQNALIEKAQLEDAAKAAAAAAAAEKAKAKDNQDAAGSSLSAPSS